MTFEIGDKVRTNTGLYVGGVWRNKGFKGKVVAPDNGMGTVAVEFKGLAGARFLRPEYLRLRKAAKKEEPKVERPFKKGDSVVFKKDVVVGMTVEVTSGIWAEVVENIPHSNLVIVTFDDGSDSLTVAEEVLQSEDDYFGGEEEATDEPEFDSEESEPLDVQEALALVLERIEEIKTLLTTTPKHEVYFSFNEASFVTPEPEEEPAPEPVFKKAKEVAEGDSLYTEAGVWDKVSRIETKDSGYTSLYGAFGNKIVQVPSGRVVQVLEEVA